MFFEAVFGAALLHSSMRTHTIISISIDPDLLKRLDRHAKANLTNRSQFIRQVVLTYLRFLDESAKPTREGK